MSRSPWDRAVRKLGSFRGRLVARTLYRRHLILGPKAVVEPGVVINQHPDDTLLTVTIGARGRLGRGTLIQGSGTFAMGYRSYCMSSCVFNVSETVTIGDDVIIGEHVSIRDTRPASDRTDQPMILQGKQTEPVFIEDNVLIGAGSQVLPGVRIGSGAIVEPGSVVATDVEPNMVVGGVPAVVLRSREDVASS